MSLSQSKPAKPQLKLDWCSHEAAKFSVEHWHYSKCLPVGKLVKVGVWENDKFIGCVLFSRGANRNILSPYGLDQTQGCELTRVALTKHQTPVSRILAIAIKMLRSLSPGLRLLVSYADPEQHHYGGIYQACNWIYTGPTNPDTKILYQGKKYHKKSFHSLYGSAKNVTYTEPTYKHKYLYPLDDEMKKQILPLAKPYPKKPCAASIEGDALSVPTERGRFDTTAALQDSSQEVMNA